MTGSTTITATANDGSGIFATCTVTVTQGSGIGIEFTGFGDETIDLTPNYINDLSRRNYDTLTVTVSGSYASIRWYVDSQNWGGSGDSTTIYASNHSVSVHYLTAVVQTTDMPPKYFSKELSFRVVE
jgi:hypothetical protein